MTLDGNDHLQQRVGVITMVRRAEFPSAWSSLDSVLPQLGPRVHHFILLNDRRDVPLETTIAGRAYTTCLAPGINLGVAGGRNRLIGQALDWGADLVFALDDDLIAPSDLISRCAEAYRLLEDRSHQVGIVSPAVLDFRTVAEATMTPDAVESARAGDGIDVGDTAALKNRLRSQWGEAIPERAVYHLGIRHWHSHYITAHGRTTNKVRDLLHAAIGGPPVDTTPTELKKDAAARAQVPATDPAPISVDTLPGGASMYSRTLIESIGDMDVAFSPFGYEDSDFAVRALRSGFRHYMLPSEVVLHDLDARRRQREFPQLLYTQARSRVLLARRHAGFSRPGTHLLPLFGLDPFLVTDVVRDGKPEGRSKLGRYTAGALSYVLGWLDGVLRDGGVSAKGGDLLPSRLETREIVDVPVWEGTPATGLPAALKAIVEVSYRWDPAEGSFALHQLACDAPGLLRGRVSFTVSVGDGTAPALGSGRLHAFTLEVADEGFVKRLDQTVAWRRRQAPTDHITPIFAQPAGPTGKALWWFLSAGRGPAHLRVSIEPDHPPRVSDLLAVLDDPRATERILRFSVAVGRGAGI